MKALYLDGITYFNEPDTLKDIIELMKTKQIYIRMPLEELDVLLEIEDEAKGKTISDTTQDVSTVSSEEDA